MIHYEIYYDGNIGMANALMSIENGVILASEIKQDITFYRNKPLFNSEKGLMIDDLFHFGKEFSFGKPDVAIKTLPHDLHDTIILTDDSIVSKEYLNGRNKIIKTNGLVVDIRTKDDKTLSFYSYLFHGDKKRLVRNCKYIPKEKYSKEAWRLIDKYKSYNSLNVRRGDYLQIDNTVNRHKNVSDYKHIVDSVFDKRLMLIHTDEKDTNYFKDFKNYVLIQNEISDEFDSAEKGLIGMIIAQEANCFIGTHYSTYSAMIQRYRWINYGEDFRYIYSQDGIISNDGLVNENWYGVNAPSWGREYKCCI